MANSVTFYNVKAPQTQKEQEFNSKTTKCERSFFEPIFTLKNFTSM